MLLKASFTARSTLRCSPGEVLPLGCLDKIHARRRVHAQVRRDCSRLSISAAGEGELAFFDLDDDAGQVIREGLRIRKGGDRSADFRDQLRGIEPAIEPHAFGETADAKKLARAILGFGNSVGIEDKHVFRLEGLSDLFIDFPFAHPKRHVRALQRRAGGRAMPIVDYRHVPAIDGSTWRRSRSNRTWETVTKLSRLMSCRTIFAGRG